MDEDLIVMSLFDGMSCGQIALKENGFKVKTFFASEIDKFAIQVTKSNFPNTQQLGSILNWRSWDIDWKTINLILAGSPCQGFSFAGKQLNFNDERSKLFFVFVDILNHVKKLNPDVKFLLENVIMKKEYQKVINDMLGIFPVRINSNLVSAQNRDRLYWSNIKIKIVGLFNEIHTDIEQPKDKGVLLKDILQPESEIDEKYFLSDKALNRASKKEYSKPKINPQKTGTLNTKNNSGQCSFDSGTTLIGLDINKKAPTQRSSTGRCLDNKHNYQIIKLDKQLNKKADQNKAGCLTGGGNSGGNHSDMDIIKIIQLPRGYNKGGEFKEKTPTLTSNDWGSNNILDAGPVLRRLTPLECARLQTIPSWYKWECSDTQQYKMLGNGWTIEVIKHILKYL